MDTRNWPMVTAGAIAGFAVLAMIAVTVAAGVVIAHYEGGDGIVAKPPPAYSQGPVEAIVDLSDSGKDRWGASLGDKCNLDKVYVLAIEESPEGVDVVSIPGLCETARLLITPDDGSVRAEDPLFYDESASAFREPW